MKKTGAGGKLGGQMIKGVVPFDGAKAAKAMNEISGVPDKYVTLFRGTELARCRQRGVAQGLEDFDGFKALATSSRIRAQRRWRGRAGKGPSPPRSTT
jgi:cytochrome c556